jgi:hypothetical protein
MEWLIDALRAPLAELLEVAVLAALALVTARLRGKQKRAHDRLRSEGLLPPARSASSSSSRKPAE